MRSAKQWACEGGSDYIYILGNAGIDAIDLFRDIQADALDEAIAVCNRLSYQFYGAQKCEEALRALIRHPAPRSAKQ